MIQHLFPVLCVDDLEAGARFHRRLLGLDVEFDSGWYMVLGTPGADGGRTPRLGLVRSGHPTVPVETGPRPAGVLVSVIVPDVDIVHDAALEMGAPIVWPLCDEEFGQRHFMVADPSGAIVDVITEISPARAFLREVAARRRGQGSS